MEEQTPKSEEMKMEEQTLTSEEIKMEEKTPTSEEIKMEEQTPRNEERKRLGFKKRFFIPALFAIALAIYLGSGFNHESQKFEEIRMIIIGESGSGKSATGNTILDKNAFNAVLSGRSTINTVKIGTNNRFNHKLIVLDTPDFSNVENTSLEISKCYGMTSPGLHAILLVIGIGRMHEDLARKYENFLKYFGEDAKFFVTVVFTFKLKLEQDGISISEYILSLPSKLKEVVNSVNGRYVIMGYKGDKAQREKEVKNLINIIKENKNVQPRGVLSNENYNNFEVFIRNLENESNNRENIRKKFENGDIKNFPKIKKIDKESFKIPDFFSTVKNYFLKYF